MQSEVGSTGPPPIHSAAKIPGILLIGPGLVVSFLTAMDLASTLVAWRWSPTDGVVTSVESRATTSGKRSTERLIVSYEYGVAGEVQHGSAYEAPSLSGVFSKRRETAPMTTGYEVGQTVAVWYDPADHSRAALNISMPLGSLFMFLVGGACVGLGGRTVAARRTAAHS